MSLSIEEMKQRFAFYLKEELKRKKVKKKIFASDISVTPNTVSLWVNAREFPSWRMYCEICNALQKQPSYFLQEIKRKAG